MIEIPACPAGAAADLGQSGAGGSPTLAQLREVIAQRFSSSMRPAPVLEIGM